MLRDWETSAIFPKGKWYNTGANPAGQANAIAEMFFEKAFPKLVPPLEAGAGILSAKPQAISLFYEYEAPPSPSTFAAEYAADVQAEVGPIPAGLGQVKVDTEELVKDAAVSAVKKAAIEAVAKGVAMQIGAEAVPVAKLAIAVADVVKDYKSIVEDESARWSAAFGLTSAVAAAFAIPVVGQLAAIGALAKGFIDFRQAKEEIEKQKRASEELSKMLRSSIDAVMPEVQALVETIQSRGYGIDPKGTEAFRKDLLKHYRALLATKLKRSPFKTPTAPYEAARKQMAAQASELEGYLKSKVYSDKAWGNFTRQLIKPPTPSLESFFEKVDDALGKSSYIPRGSGLSGLGFGMPGSSIDEKLFQAAQAAQKKSKPYIAPEKERQAAIYQQLTTQPTTVFAQPLPIDRELFARFWRVDPDKLPDVEYRITDDAGRGLGYTTTLRKQYDQLKTAMEKALGDTVGAGELSGLKSWRSKWLSAWKDYDKKREALFESVAGLPRGGELTGEDDWLVKAVGQDNMLRYERGRNAALFLLGKHGGFATVSAMQAKGGIGDWKDALWTADYWNDTVMPIYNKMMEQRWGRRDMVRAFLQLARDMRKVRLALEKLPPYLFENEVKMLGEAIVAADSLIPMSLAVAIAADLLQPIKGRALTPAQRKQVGGSIAKRIVERSRTALLTARFTPDYVMGLLVPPVTEYFALMKGLTGKISALPRPEGDAPTPEYNEALAAIVAEHEAPLKALTEKYSQAVKVYKPGVVSEAIGAILKEIGVEEQRGRIADAIAAKLGGEFTRFAAAELIYRATTTPADKFLASVGAPKGGLLPLAAAAAGLVYLLG